MAEAYLQHKDYDVVYTGLFCHEEDASAQRVGSVPTVTRRMVLLR